MPGPDHAVGLGDRIGLQAAWLARRRRDDPRIGNLLAGAVQVKGPRVEGAANGLALDDPAVTDVGAQVRTIGLGQAGDAALGAIQHQILAEIADRLDVADLQLIRIGDKEPTERNRHGEPVDHG